MTTITAQVEAIIVEIAPACVDCSEHVVANRLSAMRRLAERLYPIIEAAEARAREEGAKAMQEAVSEWLRADAEQTEREATRIVADTTGDPRKNAAEWALLVSLKRGIATAIAALDPAQIAGGKP